MGYRINNAQNNAITKIFYNQYLCLYLFVLDDFHAFGLFFYCKTLKHYIFYTIYKHFKCRAVKPLKQVDLST